MNKSNLQKVKSNQRVQEFLLTFLSENEWKKQVNGFWLVKQHNPVLNKTFISIYTDESLAKRESYLDQKREEQKQLEFLSKI